MKTQGRWSMQSGCRSLHCPSGPLLDIRVLVGARTKHFPQGWGLFEGGLAKSFRDRATPLRSGCQVTLKNLKSRPLTLPNICHGLCASDTRLHQEINWTRTSDSDAHSISQEINWTRTSVLKIQPQPQFPNPRSLFPVGQTQGVKQTAI